MHFFSQLRSSPGQHACLLPLQSAVSPTLRWPAGHAADVVATVVEVVLSRVVAVFTVDVEVLVIVDDVVGIFVMPAVVDGVLVLVDDVVSILVMLAVVDGALHVHL